MSNEIFRDESLQQINSPDNLNDYIKIASSGIWMLLGSILLILVGGIFWCIFANLETKADSAVVVNGSSAKCYLSEDDSKYISDNMTIIIDGQKYPLGEHNANMEKLSPDDSSDEVYLHVMNHEKAGWYFIYDIEGLSDLKDGIYKGTIIIDSVKPISFFVNGK